MTVDINKIAEQAVRAGGNVYVLTIESGSSPTIVFGNNFAGTATAKKAGKKEVAPAPPPSTPPVPVAPPAPTPPTGGSPAPTPPAPVPPPTGGTPPPPPGSPPAARPRR